MKRIVIIGNGIAGVTAARHIRKLSDDEIVVVSAESDYFFSRTALMYIYMGHMTFEETKPYEDSFWRKNRIRLQRARVEAVETRERRVRLAGGETLAYDALIIASGSRSNRFDWPGQDLPGVQGLYSIQDLESMERDTAGLDRAVVVGGGLIGVETAEMLSSRGIPVTFLVRESAWMDFAFPPAESQMIGRHIRGHGIDLRLSTELKQIVAGPDGRAAGVITGSSERIDCGFVALTVGVSPNIAFVEGAGIECDRGILVDERLQTNVDSVYAIGDCAQLRRPPPGRRAIEPVWYTGRAMGRTVARTICDRPTAYDPGIWFNSAKFFDLEWQVYGRISPTAPAGEEQLYWEDASGRKSIRIQYRREDDAVVGFNLIGIRYRHEVCDRWIRRATPLPQVLENLAGANFDPELSAEHEAAVVAEYRREHPERSIRLRKRRGLFGRRRAS